MSKKEYSELVNYNCYFELKDRIEKKSKRDRVDLDYYILCLKKMANYDLAEKLMTQYSLPLREETLSAISQKKLLLELQNSEYVSDLKSKTFWLSRKVNFDQITDQELIEQNNRCFNREIAYELMMRSYRNRHALGVAFFINQLISDGVINTSIAEGLAWLYKQFQNDNLVIKVCELCRAIKGIDTERLSYIEAESYISLGRPQDAKMILDEKAKAGRKSNIKYQLLLLKMFRQLSDKENEVLILKQLIMKGIETEETLTSTLKNKHGNAQEAIRKAEAYLQKYPESYSLLRSLAESAETDKDYARAYRFYKMSADRNREKGKFDKPSFILQLNTIPFLRKKLSTLKFDNQANGKAVFIVGLPRSGTTITEKLIYSIGNFKALGESEGITRFINAYGYPTTIESLSKFRDYYLSSNYISNNENFIDKNPNNYLYLDLIKKIWPDCRIVYCTKQKKINAWSLYKSRFAGDSYRYTNDQQEIEFVIESERHLLDQYRLDYPDLFVLENEALVLDQEKTIKSLEQYIGGTIDFEGSRDYVAKTMSAGQLSNIRRKVDTSYKFYSQYWTYLAD